MKKLIWLVVFQLAALTILGQSRAIDSLAAELTKNSTQDHRRVDILNELSLRIFRCNPEKSMRYAEEALTISSKINFPKGKATAENNMSFYFLMTGESEKSLQLVLDALQIAEREQSPELQAETCSILGVIYYNQQSNTKSLQFLVKALDLKPTSSIVSSRVFNILGSIARDKKSYDSALAYYEKAIGIMKEAHDDHLMPEVLNNIGTVYLRQGKLEPALRYFRSCASEAEASGNRRAQVLANINISAVLIDERKYAEAEELVAKSLLMAREMNDKKKVLQIYLTLATIKMETGKFHEAHLLMSEHYALKDSLQYAERNRQIAEMETRYETEKKDQTIRSLQQEKQIHELKQWYWFVGSLALIVAFGVFYFLQRFHHKKVISLLETQKILNQKLQESDQLKSKFFANISHEFRTPLTLILAPIEEKLASTPLSALDRRSFELVKRNANRLLTLINQLLDLSKLEAKKMSLVIQQGNMNELLRVVAASFDSFAETRKIQFQKDIQFDLSETWFDSDKLEKILCNVLFNAFKFTKAEGTVTFVAQTVPHTHDLQIKITDTGKGIPEHELPYVFFPFYQTRHNEDDASVGTGLGLSLVKELVSLHHGTIDLTSAVNVGTTITITIPVALNRLPNATIKPSVHGSLRHILNGMDEKIYQLNDHGSIDQRATQNEDEADGQSKLETVLIIEDNHDLRNFISNSLRDQFITLTAGNGRDGYNLAIESIPDLIISDVMMPVLDGIELSAKLKNDERTSHIPIVLLTAKADKDSRIEGLQKGADDYLAKPFSMDELRVRVTNLIEQRKKLAAKYRAAIPSIPIEPVLDREFTIDEKFLLRASKLVEDNISDSRFGVEQMAKEIGLSRAQLFRKLKAIAGFSPNEFINEIRLQKAAKLILFKTDTLAQIGYSVGFNEQSYFAKCFRKKFGVSPSEYANKEVGQEA